MLFTLLWSVHPQILKDHLHGIDQGGVEKYDRHQVIPERLCDAGDLLDQHPQTDAIVPSPGAETDQVARAPSRVF